MILVLQSNGLNNALEQLKKNDGTTLQRPEQSEQLSSSN